MRSSGFVESRVVQPLFQPLSRMNNAGGQPVSSTGCPTPCPHAIPYNLTMPEDPGKDDEFDLSPELEGYISLDEARVLALQHARDICG